MSYVNSIQAVTRMHAESCSNHVDQTEEYDLFCVPVLPVYWSWIWNTAKRSV